MWLEFQIDCADLFSVIFFEVKVAKDCLIQTLKKFTSDLLNLILQSENLPIHYEPQHISLQKLKMTADVLIATDLRSSMVGQTSKTKKIKETVDADTVKNLFNYINRYVLCVPPSHKSLQNIKQRRGSLQESLFQSITSILQNAALGFQLRNTKAERKIQVLKKKNSKGKGKISEIQKNQVCACVVM